MNHITMKPEQQRIAIAKAIGWSQPEPGYWKDPDGHEWQVMHGYQTYKDGSDILPDFLHDLNAMHDVEEWMSFGSNPLPLYAEHIRRLVGNPTGWSYKMMMATASQRAEAFLKSYNLWEEVS